MIPYNNSDINWKCLASNKIARKWVVDEIHYDEEHGTYSIYKLNQPESAIFGTPFGAYTHAKHILNKYKKKWSDAIIVIKEFAIKED